MQRNRINSKHVTHSVKSEKVLRVLNKFNFDIKYDFNLS